MWRIRHDPLTKLPPEKVAEMAKEYTRLGHVVGIYIEGEGIIAGLTPAKRCPSCKTVQRAMFDFRADASRPDGRCWRCKSCEEGARK